MQVLCMVVLSAAGNSTAIGKACSAARCSNWVQDNLQNGVREGSEKERTGKGSAGPFARFEARGPSSLNPKME